MTLLAVPPLLPSLKAELGLSNTEVAALTTLPLLLFSVAATVGSAVVSAMGARRTLMAGLVLAGIASALRGIAPSTVVLFTFTFLMGLGIAAVQPAMPALIRAWKPAAIGRATATYVNGLLVAEAVAASLTIPLLLPALGSWEAALAVWATPLVVTAALVGMLSSEEPEAPPPSRWLPSWTERRTWRLGLTQAAGSVAYFGSNAIIPVFLHARGRADLVGWTLTVLNTAQVLASVVVGLLPLSVLARRGAIAVNAAAVAAGAVGVVEAPDLAVLWGGLIGFSSALMFTVSLALPAVLAKGEDVARLSAGMFTIGYGLAFLLPLAGGGLWDATGSAWAALSPVLAAGIAGVLVGGLPRGYRSGQPGFSKP